MLELHYTTWYLFHMALPILHFPRVSIVIYSKFWKQWTLSAVTSLINISSNLTPLTSISLDPSLFFVITVPRKTTLSTLSHIDKSEAKVYQLRKYFAKSISAYSIFFCSMDHQRTLHLPIYTNSKKLTTVHSICCRQA